MVLFLLIFFVVYGGSHAYFFLKARRALAPGLGATLLLALFLLLMVLAPLLVRLLERSGHEILARGTAYAGYLWMGVLFLFIAVAFPLDLYGGFVRLAGLLAKRDVTTLLLADRIHFMLCLGLAAVVSLYGWFEAQAIRTEQVTIATAKLPAGLDRLRIVQISDVHVGLIVREERVARILAAVRAARPDLLVSTGDLVDGHVSHFDNLSSQFREISPRFGSYAILGNHEYYAGLGQAISFTERAGFRVLRGEALTVAGISVAGLDDPAARQVLGPGAGRQVGERELLAPLPRDRFTLFLKHRPAVAPEARGLFDLQLSGHVHKGQIFPFTFLTWLAFPVRAGLNSLAEGGVLYVSRGTGTWGPPIRFLAPPEVTVIDLVPAKESGP